jgi:hypothetical protein
MFCRTGNVRKEKAFLAAFIDSRLGTDLPQVVETVAPL